jgi:hypothetical protein
MKSQWSNDPDRIAYFEHEKTRYNRLAIDEFVIHNANVHLECMDDSSFYLIVDNDIHEWRFAISSYSGKAKIVASLVEDDSPEEV